MNKCLAFSPVETKSYRLTYLLHQNTPRLTVSPEMEAFDSPLPSSQSMRRPSVSHHKNMATRNSDSCRGQRRYWGVDHQRQAREALFNRRRQIDVPTMLQNLCTYLDEQWPLPRSRGLAISDGADWTAHLEAPVEFERGQMDYS